MPELPAGILIVDDKLLVRTTLSESLGEIGYRVRTAQSALTALSEFQVEVPDILIADLHMPGMSGFELLRSVRRQFPAVLVIAMSGAYIGTEVPAGVLADAFFRKGCTIAVLLAIIATPPRVKRWDIGISLVPTPRSNVHTVQVLSVDGVATVGCNDCGRSATILTGRSARLICNHCGNSLEYASAEAAPETPTSQNSDTDARDLQTSPSVRRQA